MLPTNLTPKALAALATVAAVGSATTYSRVLLPIQTAKLAEMKKLNGDLSVAVERTGGGI